MAGRHVAYALLALAAGLLAVAGLAAAAPLDARVTVNATFPDAPFTPFVEKPGFPGLSEVEVRFPMRIDVTVPAGHAAGGPMRVTPAASELPFWLDVRFEPPVVDFPTGALPATEDATYTRTVDVVAHATFVAPSNTQGNVELVATATRSGQAGRVGPVTSLPTQGIVVARPYAVFVADVKDRVIVLERFDNATIDVAVANTGNALAAAVVQVAHADPGLEVEVLTPIPVVFKPNPMEFEPETGRVPVEIRHRSGAGGEVLLLVTTALPADGWLVQESAVRLHVDVAATGGPGATLPLLGLLAVAGVVFLLRRT